MIIGKTVKVLAAICNLKSLPPSVMKAYRPIGNVLKSSELITSKVQRKEFQQEMAFNSMIVTKLGLAIGTMIRHKYFQLLAPSILAL